MFQYPVFKAHYHVEIIADRGVLLLSENNSIALSGAVYAAVARLIETASLTTDQIVEALADQYTLEYVYYALIRLESDGYLAEKNNLEIPPEQNAFWSATDLNQSDRIKALQSSTVSISVVGLADAKLLEEKLALYGVRTSGLPTESNLLDIVITDDYLQSDLIEYNERALKAKRPWLLMRPNGLACWIGPLFIPGKTGCYSCLYQRLKHHQLEKTLLMREKNSTTPVVTALGSLPTTVDIAYSAATIEILKYLIHPVKNALEGKVLSIDFSTWESRYHLLHREHHCRYCGQPPVLTKSPIILHQQETVYTTGGYRTVSAEEIIKKYKNFISPITGLISEIHPELDGPSNVYLAGHNWAVCMEDNNILQSRVNFRRYSAGKGVTKDQAEAGAFCEAIERFCGVFQGTEQRITSSYHRIEKEAIHPCSVMLYSKKQYQERDHSNKIESTFNRVPMSFDESTEIDWTPIWSLMRKKHFYLPTQYLYYGYHGFAHTIKPVVYCYADSNGNAAGSTLEEAILQGLFELIERDCVALWWYNRLTKPAVDIGSFNEPSFDGLQKYYHSLNRDVWALDLMSDLGIPTFVVISSQRDEKEYISFGFGCHTNAKIAMERALTEMNQMLTSIRKMNQNPVFSSATSEVTHWLNTARLADCTYLLPSKEIKKMVRTDYGDFQGENLVDALNCCIEKIERNGMEVFVLDQTRPEIDLKVVKVIVPGLRNFWARYAPGRLYDVPVKMGWLKTPLEEEALNPTPFFL